MERLALKDLVVWDNDPHRKPLMVYGARQVGKTYLIRDIFAKTYYPNKYIYISFKFDDDIRDYVNGEGSYKRPTSSASKILNHISLWKNTIIDEHTLLIFDEIQEALPAITALKDFKENHPNIRIIASGSLVRIKIARKSKDKKKFFYPVGALDELMMFPMNFEEYLLNANPILLKRIQAAYAEKCPLDESAHQLALDTLHEYMLVGGLPENVKIYLQSKSLVKARKNLRTIYRDYLNDIALYDAPMDTLLRTRKLFESLYIEINRPLSEFRPSVFDPGKKVRDYFLPVNLLKLGEVVYQAKRTKEHVSIPLKEDNDSDYRLYCLDTGFLAYQSDIALVDFQKSNNTNMGVFFENYIACELTCIGLELFYWKGKNNAEFEFLVKQGEDIFPIDVKKRRGNLTSMNAYASHNKVKMFVKVSSNHYGYDATNKILTMPLYAFFLFVRDIVVHQE